MTETEIGKIIKEAREKINYSQEDLGKLCGISATHITYIETGRTLKPQKKTLYSIAKVLRLDYNTLLLKAGYPLIKVEELQQSKQTAVDLERLIEDTVNRTISKISIAKGEVGVLRPLIKLAKCGEPSRFAYSEDQVRISSDYANDTDFVVLAEGDSMEEYHIPNGAKVYVKKQNYCNTGDIALICNNDEMENSRLCLKKAKELPGIGMIFLNGSGNEVFLGEKIEIVGVVKHILISV